MTSRQVADTARQAAVLGPGNRRDRITGRVFLGFLILSLAVGFVTLAALIVDVLIDGVGSLGSQLLLNAPSVDPEKAGARPAILASLYIGVLLIAFSVPVGVGTAIYLEEYARKDRWYNRLLELNIQNLAAVPAIVYGILGLAFVVRGPLGLGPAIVHAMRHVPGAAAATLSVAQAHGRLDALRAIGGKGSAARRKAALYLKLGASA